MIVATLRVIKMKKQGIKANICKPFSPDAFALSENSPENLVSLFAIYLAASSGDIPSAKLE